MKNYFRLSLFVLLTTAASLENLDAQDYPIRPQAFTQVKVTDSFWSKRMKTNTEVTIPIALHQSEITGRIDNFKAAGGIISPGHRSEKRYDDSDVYKILEGVAYSLMVSPNPALEAKADSIISYIAAAQEPDGYLYTPLTNKAFHINYVPRERWLTTHTQSHELYCLGHMYEAAVAYFQATGKRSLLDVAIKSADLVCTTFGWDKLISYPGHQEIEIGLAKLYRATGEKKYLDMAKFFLDARGKKEDDKGSEYLQSHISPVEQRDAVGHCVRALYMYTGMVDVAALTSDESYIEAVRAIWDDIANTKLYITGGLGPGGEYNEGFGPKYLLNNQDAYNETCAAIANVFFNHRLFLMDGDSKYIDVMEKSLYNNILSGVSISGDRFFYPNTLETPVGDQRSEWFGCACCPSNECRFLSSFAGYIYAQNLKDIYINLYVQSSTSFDVGGTKLSIRQQSQMPWKGETKLSIDPQKACDFTLKLRIPNWARNEASPDNKLYRFTTQSTKTVKISINGKDYPICDLDKGYVSISRKWKKGDVVNISLPLEIREVVANSLVMADKAKVALQYGPIIYCSEGVDFAEPSLEAMKLPALDSLKLNFADSLFGGCTTIIGPDGFKAIPYCFFANRGKTAMRVWYGSGNFDSHFVDSDYIDDRNIYIWKPTNYDPSQKYAVLYMNDAQALFDANTSWNHKEWRVDEIVDSLVLCKSIIPTIVVAVPNHEKKRGEEFIPAKAIENLSAQTKQILKQSDRDEPLSDAYLKFLVNEVKPYIDANYPTYTDSAHTFIAGSSLGGLISMYAVCEYPDVFSGAICMSTHWTMGALKDFPEVYLDYLESHLPDPASHSFYFDFGGIGTDSFYQPYQERADSIMISNGYFSKNWKTLSFPEMEHSENFWSSRLDIPLIFMLRTQNPDEKVLDKKCIDYLEANYESPIQYVVNKCKQYDIVLLGENHRIKENLDFAAELIPQLYHNGVYNFGMEFGAEEDQVRLDSLVNAPQYDQQLARDIMFNYNTAWAFKEYMDIYRAAWELNRSLPEDAPKFRIINLSYRFNWKGIPQGELSPELYAQIFHRGDCESFRAEVVKNKIINKGEKIVILTGGTHALTKYRSPSYSFFSSGFVRYSNTGFGQRLLKMYPHNVFSISLHSYSPNYPGHKPYYISPANGKIESLIAKAGNRPIGFDLTTSPLGQLRDNGYVSMGYPNFIMSQAFDGYVFLKPLSQMNGCTVDPLFVTEKNWKEAIDNYPDKNYRTVPASIEEFMQQIRDYSNISVFYSR